MGIRIAPTDEYGRVLVWCPNCGDYEPLDDYMGFKQWCIPGRRRSNGFCGTCQKRLQDWASKQYREVSELGLSEGLDIPRS